MAKNKGGSYTAPTRAELEAMKEQKLRLVPNGEAGRRERKLLEHYGAAKDDLQWIVDNNAWNDLGFDTFTAWYTARVRPSVAAAGLRPTQEFALYVLENVQSDEAALPKQQRLLQKELAELVGVSVSTLRRLSQDPSQTSNGAGVDLDESADVEPSRRQPDPADIPDAMRQALTDVEASVETKTSADPTEDVSSVLGEPAGADLAAAPAGTPETADGGERLTTPSDGGEVSADAGDPPAPTGASVPDAPVGVTPADSPTAGAVPDLSHAGVPAVGGQEQAPACEECHGPIEDEEAKAGFLRCGPCDPDGNHSSAIELDGGCRLCQPHPFEADADGLLCVVCDAGTSVAVHTDTPAALGSLPVGASPAPEQPGQDSPTGQEAVQPRDGRSETDHHLSGVSGGEAPEEPHASVEPEGVLEDAADAQDAASSSDPDDGDEDRPFDRLLAALRAAVQAAALVDVEALAPLVFDEEMVQLHEHADGLVDWVAKLAAQRFTAMTRTP